MAVGFARIAEGALAARASRAFRSFVVSGDGTRALRDAGCKTAGADSHRRSLRTNPGGRGAIGCGPGPPAGEDDTIVEGTSDRGRDGLLASLLPLGSYFDKSGRRGGLEPVEEGGRRKLVGWPRARCRNKSGNGRTFPTWRLHTRLRFTRTAQPVS